MAHEVVRLQQRFLQPRARLRAGLRRNLERPRQGPRLATADLDHHVDELRRGAARAERSGLSNILKTFNDQFGTLFTDIDRVAKRIREDIAPKVAADTAYRNAKENTPRTARMAHDQALGKVMQLLLKDDTQVYKQFVENESFKRFVGDMVYAITNP